MYVEDEQPGVAGYGSQNADGTDSAQGKKFEYQSLGNKEDEKNHRNVYIKGFFAGVCLAILILLILVAAGCLNTGDSSCDSEECKMESVVNAICDGSDAQAEENCGVYEGGTVVRIFHVPVYPIGASNIARALEYEPIEELTLLGTSIGNDGTKSIAKKITNHAYLKALRIGDDSISTEGACAIGSMLQTNKILENLDLNKNRIGNGGAKCIADGLKGNSHLIRLIAWENIIGEQGALYLANAFKVNLVLRSLIVSDNLINNGGVGAQALHEAEYGRAQAGGELDIVWESD